MSRRRRFTLLFAIVTATFAVFAASFGGAARAIETEAFELTPHPAQANGAERGSFSIPVEPGATFEDAIRIYNRTDQPLDLAVYAADADAGPDNTDSSDVTVGFRNQRPKGVGAWIDLARDTVALAPRDEVIVTFRIKVETSEPSPARGAVVVENTARGLDGDAAQRVFLLVHTSPPNTETVSVRVRPLLLQSPWIIVAVLGLLLAAVLVIVGARRARRPKDILVPAGEIEQPQLEPEDAQVGSRPVIKRLGASESDDDAGIKTNVIARTRRSSRSEPPLIEDPFLVEVDADDEEDEIDDAELTGEPMIEQDDDFDEIDGGSEDELEDDDELPPARHRPSRPAAKKPAPKKRAKPKAAAKKKAPVRKKPQARTSAARKPAARKAAPRKAKPKEQPKKEPKTYIPLEEL